MSTPSQRLREDASNLFDLWSTPLSSRPKPTRVQRVQEPKVQARKRKDTIDPYDTTPPSPSNLTPPPAQNLEAEKLKEETNNLVSQKQYASAIHIYDEAIRLDSTNPLFYLDAASDASDAFKLDPSYIKAHVRYAEAFDAMYQKQYSEGGYQTVLKLLDKPNLTPAERKLKEEIQRNYNASKKRIFEVELAIEESLKENCSVAPPWRRALPVAGHMDIRDSKLAGTSTELLLTAFSHYLEGNRIRPTSLSCELSWGLSPAPGCESNHRVWYVWDESWNGKIYKSIVWLNRSKRGWDELSIPNQAFRDKVLKRLADEGWEKMRHSLLFTMHSWIVSTTMTCGKMPVLAAQQYGYVLDDITWGRSIWVDAGVPLPQCGLLFYPRSLLAIRKLHMYPVWGLGRDNGKSMKHNLVRVNIVKGLRAP
uniref:Uncharacterized protein n=1 Tax=Moniliophthora roreri TaxID=221103 RepID=A0A0W0FTR5_MONRR